MKVKNITAKIQVYTIEECDSLKKKLIEAAKEATTRAYAPYSKFHVGAALLLENGEIVTGSNQENAAYPTTLCAERTAIFYANSQYPDLAVKSIAIAAFADGDFTEESCAPCGSCRQVISEVENRFGKPVSVIMYGKKHIYEVSSIQDLLPLSFGKENLPEN
ncbi:MAG: cytidine deaminase [Bacteroidales bacterium 45-6]|nr:MAG: cytidine deaminase [Bacteroidales bacterium 45-6]